MTEDAQLPPETDTRSVLSVLAPALADDQAAQRLIEELDRARMAARLGLEVDEVRVGRYELEQVVGRGGMGVVFAARDTQLQRIVALKVLTFESEQARRLAAGEARALAKLAHPNVVSVFEAGVDGTLGYIVMEFIHGQSLREWMHAREHDWAEAVSLLVAAGRGLAAAHAQGLLHRDFKPDNVLLGADGRVRVVDFGLAQVRLDGEGSELPGAQAGTPAYMAPERLRGKPASAASDQFAFCMALWEACCGVRPLSVDELGRLARLESSGAESSLELGAREQLPDELSAVLEIGLAPEPSHRWPDMESVLDKLEALVESARPVDEGAERPPFTLEGVDPWTTGRLLRERRRRLGVGLVAGLALAGAVVSGWWIAEVPDKPREPVEFSAQQLMLFINAGEPEAAAGVLAPAAELDDRAALLELVLGEEPVTNRDTVLKVFEEMEEGPGRLGFTTHLTRINCLRAYLSLAEGRPSAREELATCRMMFALLAAAGADAAGVTIISDGQARITEAFGWTLAGTRPNAAAIQVELAQSHRCQAGLNWQRHLEGGEPYGRWPFAEPCQAREAWPASVPDPGEPSSPRPGEFVPGGFMSTMEEPLVTDLNDPPANEASDDE